MAPSAESLLSASLDVLALRGRRPDRRGDRSPLDCRVVAGAANNQLTTRDVAATLRRRGIVHVPDFLANCGGLIHVSASSDEDGERERERIELAMERLDRALADAEHADSTPLEVAERQALERVEPHAPRRDDHCADLY